MGERLDEIRARRALLPPVTGANVHASLERGAAAQAAFVAALRSGVADNATCWSEAADAVLAHAQVADDIGWLITTAVGLFDLRYTAARERDQALARLTMEGIRAAVAATVATPRVQDALVDLIEGDGPDTTREAEARRLVELVAAIFEVTRG